MKIGASLGVDEIIIQSTFGFNIFRGFGSTWGQNFRFPIPSALLVIVTSAAATA